MSKLSALYPYYGPLGRGNFNVSLAFPGPLSTISKNIGLETSTGLILPNTDFIHRFAEGDLGIGDSIISNMIYKNMNSSIAGKNENVFRQFAKNSGIELDSDITKYKKGNKFVLPKDSIKIPESFNMSGLKAFEKTVFQSIFETQKPFIEIVQFAIGSVVKAEDIIARVMPLFGAIPLKTKSRKPIGNAGDSSRPRALGYKGGTELKERLQTLQQIKSKGETYSVGITSSVNVNNTNDLTIKNDNINQNGINSQRWQILSIVYSTGLFNPNIEYTYSYINLPADVNLPDKEAIDLETPDPFENYKPKTIILGIYNSKGVPLDPSEYLTTVGLDGNNITKVQTPFKRAEWLLNSPKWKLPENMIEWPSFSSPNFVWEKNGLFQSTKVAPKNPGGYDLKKYKEGDINIITGVSAIPGDPVIQNFDKLEKDSYTNYYNDIIEIGLAKEKYLTEEERITYTKDINNQIEIESQLEITYNYGNTKTSFYNKVNGKDAFPNSMKKSYKPFQIYVSEAEKDLDLVNLAIKKGIKPGYIWVDPEADYDLKVVRIDPITTLSTKVNGALNGLSTTKRTFIKNRVNFSFSNKSIFSISLTKNNSSTQTFNDVTSYSLENWNYENKVVKNTNVFRINIWSKTAPKKYSSKNYHEFPIVKSNASKYVLVPNIWSSIFTEWDELTIKYIDLDTTTKLVPSNEKLTYSLNRIGDIWKFDSNDKNYIKNGIITLEDKTIIQVDKGIITKWYYIYNQEFKGPGTGVNLPTFGIDRNITINYENNNNLDVRDKTIPIWGMLKNTTSNTLVNSQIITNDFLSTADLFIKPEDGYYGHGSDDDPQDLGIIERYAMTDTDDESYYIVEGILKSDNELPTDENGNRIKGVNKSNSNSGGWYRLPHAIGAGSVFIRLLIDIAIKMLPKITKLLKLFKDPSSFVTDIMIEKLKKNFLFLSDDAISILQKSNEFRSQVTSQTSGIENLNNLVNKIRLDSRKLQDKIINDAYGRSSLELSQAQKMINDINKNTELQISQLEEIGNKKKQVVKKLRKYYKDSILSNYVYLDDKNLETIFVLDGSATTPFKLFGLDLSFGLASNMGNIPNKKPIELIFPKSKGIFKNLQYLTNKTNNKSNNDIIKQEIIDLKNPIQSKLSQLDKQPPYTNTTAGELYYSDKVQIKFQDGTSEYIPSNSLQTFVKENENKYNFIYVTEGLEKTLAEVDSLLKSGTQDDLNNASQLLDQAKKEFPNNTTIDDKQKELDNKNSELVRNTQPLLKTLLGFIKFPIKIVTDIIQWLFNFFKSLTNPMKLASKMKEFLSFEWILKYFTPTGILDIFGFKFNPATLAPFAAEAAKTSGKLPNLYGVPTINSTSKMDLSKFLNVGFVPKLPTYTADQYKNLLIGTQPIRSLSILKIMEDVINKIIDFIWSLFGIEALIKAPHIKIVSDSANDMSPEDIKKIVDGIEPAGNNNKVDNNPITSDGDSNTIDTVNPGVETFIYYITLPDGTQQQYLNREELDKFIQEHKEINYDFTF